MGARHSNTIAQNIQVVAGAEQSLYRETSKINVTQARPPPDIHNIGGRGKAGIGTVYPINAPLDDRATVSDSAITIAMTSPKHHYVKIALNNLNPVVTLSNLIVGLSTVFTLDFTNTIALTTMTFSPTLINAPTFDKTINARNVLHIVGHRSASETRYEVISGSAVGAGSSPLTTKGDVFVYGVADDRLPVGTDGEVLTADSTEALGVKWGPGGTGGSQTPWTQPIDAANFPLFNTIFITMDFDTSADIGALRLINDVGIRWRNAANTDNHGIILTDIDEFEVDAPWQPTLANDGVLNLGQPTQAWNQINADSLVLRHNNGLVSTEPSIGRTGANLRLNTPSGNNIELEVAGVDKFLVENLGVTLPENLRMQFNATNNASILKAGSDRFQFISKDGFIFETGPGTNTPNIVCIRGDFSTNGLVPSQLIFEGDNSSGIAHEYALIKARINDNTSLVEDGSLEFEVYESGAAVKKLEINGGESKIKVWDRMEMQSGHVFSIEDQYLEFVTSRSNPGHPGPPSMIRRLFLDSGNSDHLTVETPSGAIDLEALGSGGEVFVWTAAHDANGNDFILTADQNTRIQNNTNDLIKFQIAGVTSAITLAEVDAHGSIQWLTAGAGHALTATSTGLEMVLGVSTDNIRFDYSDPDIHTVFTGNHAIFSSDSNAFIFESNYTESNLASNTVIALYQWNARSDGGGIETFAEMRVTGTDMDNGQEDSDIDFRVMRNSVFTNIVRFDGSTNELLMVEGGDIDLNGGTLERIGGFDLNNPEQLDATPTVTEISTALRNLGLTEL